MLLVDYLLAIEKGEVASDVAEEAQKEYEHVYDSNVSRHTYDQGLKDETNQKSFP